MNLYAETSAVLAWLLGERRGAEVREALAGAEVVLASEVTILEAHRVLLRAVSAAKLTEAVAGDLRAHLANAAKHWVRLAVDEAVLDRAGRAFPAEPIRALDAVHLASALAARSVIAEVALLSLDDRVRRSGAELGFALVPASA